MEAAVEPTLSCPYNKAHSIIESRMQFHLSKCRNQHPTNEKAICPFNSTHIIPKVEYEYHLSFCPDRIVLDAFTCKVGSSNSSKVELTKIEPISIKSDENWDVCTHLKICENKTVHERFLVKVGSSFVPQVNLTAPNIQVPDGESWDTNEESSVSVLERVHEASKAKPTLQALIGAPKSERKAFRNQERLRIQRVLDNQGNKVGEASGSGLAREGTSGRTSVPHCSRDMQADERREPKHNINYSHNSRQTNTKECRKTTQNENTCAIPGPSRESRSRDLRNNAWGTQQNRNDLLITSGSTIYPRLINGGASSSSRGGQGLPPPPRNSNSEETRRPPTTAERRDPGNPWRVKRSPPPAARCNSSNDPSTEFPTLPAASRGRGRKS